MINRFSHALTADGYAFYWRYWHPGRPSEHAEQYFQALRPRQVPSALVRIPGASHHIAQRSSQMLAQVLNTAAWFGRHRKCGARGTKSEQGD